VQVISGVGSVFFHLLLLLILSFLVLNQPRPVELVELDWGSSSGAPNQAIKESETTPNKQRESAEPTGATSQSKVSLPEMKSSSEATIPQAKKTTPKSSVGQKKSNTTAEEVPTPRHRRSKEGVAGGAGKSTGYSIEWSGVGSRRLLSGRIPQYPEGTDKEMPVYLQFTVLPDGSVSTIIPLKKSDELLEREAIAALRTWRFDPLPPQFEQLPQVGKITFIFKLE
jgi:protein TonB